jgi:hypothetical protein
MLQLLSQLGQLRSELDEDGNIDRAIIELADAEIAKIGNATTKDALCRLSTNGAAATSRALHSTLRVGNHLLKRIPTGSRNHRRRVLVLVASARLITGHSVPTQRQPCVKSGTGNAAKEEPPEGGSR